MYLEFLLRRAHSRSRVERKYWSGESLYSRTTCSNSVIVGVMGPMGSGLPQLGFPRRVAMKITPRIRNKNPRKKDDADNLDSRGLAGDSRQIVQSNQKDVLRCPQPTRKLVILRHLCPRVNRKHPPFS